MKSIRPAFIRSLSSAFCALFWTSIVLAVASAMIYVPLWVDDLNHPRRALPESVQHLLLMGAVTLGVVFVAAVALHQLFFVLSSRYEVGATELTVERGFLWRHRRSIPLVDVLRIDISSGPLSRFFGLSDLQIVKSDQRHPRQEAAVALLLGVEDGEAVRRFLLERRHHLQEAALLGELPLARSSQDLQLERLASAVERLERRLSK
jgi:membrane protein YdbS with pleckstrin-like domain